MVVIFLKLSVSGVLYTRPLLAVDAVETTSETDTRRDGDSGWRLFRCTGNSIGVSSPVRDPTRTAEDLNLIQPLAGFLASSSLRTFCEYCDSLGGPAVMPKF